MPNSTAAGAMTAALPLALGEAVAVLVADAPAVVVAVGVSVSAGVPVPVLDIEPVLERVRAGVRVSDVEGVPVCDGDDEPVALGVTVVGGVTLPDALGLPVPEEDAPAVSELEGVLVALAVAAAVSDAVWLRVGSGEPLRLLLDVGTLVFVSEPLGRAVLEPVPEGVGVAVPVAGGVALREPVPDAVDDGSTPGDNDAVAVAVTDADTLAVLLAEGEPLRLRVGVRCCEALTGVRVPVTGGVAVRESVAGGVALRETVAGGVALREPVPDAVVEGSTPGDSDAVTVAVTDAEPLAELLQEAEGLRLRVRVRDCDGATGDCDAKTDEITLLHLLALGELQPPVVHTKMSENTGDGPAPSAAANSANVAGSTPDHARTVESGDTPAGRPPHT